MKANRIKRDKYGAGFTNSTSSIFNDINIKVCGISHADEFSRSFNGLGSSLEILKEGIEYSLLSDIHMRNFGRSLSPKLFLVPKKLVIRFERFSGFQSRFFFWSSWIRFRAEFKNADVIHYHILHNEFFRIEALKNLSKKKKSVWTLHDLWLSTGHCIQPLECERFGKGCGSCPDLSRTLAVQRDRTDKEFLRKKKLVSQIDCDYIVSTNWMRLKTLSTLPINSNRLHIVPFGVDTEFFKPLSKLEKLTLQKEHFLDPKYTYVFINAHDDYIKGIDIVEKLISDALPNSRLRFILIDSAQKWKYSPNVISFPRAMAPEEIRRLIQMSDLVVIPSRGESFSLIALESMSCGKPVVTLRNSAPHEVTDSKEEFTFTLRDSAKQILNIVDTFSKSKDTLTAEGERNRARVLKNFSMEIHIMKMAEIYRNILKDNIDA